MMLVTNLTFGGAETQVVRLATEFKARNWDVCVVSMMEPDTWVNQLEREGVAVQTLGMPRGLPDPRALLRLRSLIKSFSPDVVHCHMFHANILGRIAKLFCGIPALVCTVHNLRETSERGGPTGYKEFLYRITDRLASITTIICQAAFDRYVKVGAVPRKRLIVIPNGIDTEAFSPSSARRESARKALGLGSEFVWLAVGRLVKQKDYPNLFRAVAQCESKEFRVLIAGSGPLEAELVQECASLGLSDVIQFCGAREDMLDLYSAADAFVMSSEFEGLSVALIEAAAMGLPAVVTDAGGNADIVVEGVTGFVVPTKAPGALSGAMMQLVGSSKDRLKTMSEEARAHCLGNYKASDIVDKWIDLYAQYSSRISSRRADSLELAESSTLRKGLGE
jgi:glycosyltransferase involved in cell wall biosynthesis